MAIINININAASICNVPSNVIASGGVGQFSINWDGVTGAVGYFVIYRKQNESNSIVTLVTLSEVIITGLSVGTYIVELRTICGILDNESDAVQVTVEVT